MSDLLLIALGPLAPLRSCWVTGHCGLNINYTVCLFLDIVFGTAQHTLSITAEYFAPDLFSPEEEKKITLASIPHYPFTVQLIRTEL